MDVPAGIFQFLCVVAVILLLLLDCAGPTLGLTIYPLRSASFYYAGLYLDICRSRRIYENRYYTAERMGG